MTNAAREVLADCEIALEMLESEEDLARWRIVWAGAVSLLRAVGHVLDKVDGADSAVAAASRQAFKMWKHAPEHQIFRDFIEHERNSLLKEYRSGVHPLPGVPVAVIVDAVSLADGSTVTLPLTFDLDRNVYRPLLEGPWEGDDAREVLEEAIKWWKVELTKIDVAVAGSNGGRPSSKRRC